MNDSMQYALWFLFGSILVVSLLLPFASAHPDGLEKVAESLGFASSATELYGASPMPDYDAFGDEGYLSVFTAEIAGVGLTLFLGFGLGYFLKKNAS